MFLLKLAWKNLWRNQSRTLITMSAIFFAVILSIFTSSLKDGAFENLVKNIVGIYTGYIQVHKAGYQNEQILDNSFEATQAIENKLLKQPNIKGIAPRLESFALASAANITKGIMLVGINPALEDKVSLLKSKIIDGKYLQENNNEVLLTEGLSERLNLKINDTIILIGQGYHGATAAGKYRIIGILKFGSPNLNNQLMYMPLAAAQDFFGAKGMLTSYILLLNNPNYIDDTAKLAATTLGNNFEIIPWYQIIPEIKQHIETDSKSMVYVHGVLYMLICFGIFGTLLMMMVERNYEMGMLVAIGMKKIHLMVLMVFESIFTVFAGCFLGVLASIPVVYYFNIHPIKIGGEMAKTYEKFGFEAIFPSSTDTQNFIEQCIIVLIIGLVLSLYPLYKIYRLDPVTAMKK